MIISKLKIISFTPSFHKGKLIFNNLSSRDAPAGIIMRNPTLLGYSKLYIADSLCNNYKNIIIQNLGEPVRFPADSSFILIDEETINNFPLQENEDFLFIGAPNVSQFQYITNGLVFYINGQITEILTGRAGSVGGLIYGIHNLTIWEGHRYVFYMREYDWWEINNLSGFCIHDQIFFGYSIWKIPDTDPQIDLYIHWHGPNASYVLYIGVGGIAECIKIDKYWENGSDTPVNFCCEFNILQNSTWNAVYINLRQDKFYQNDSYKNAYSSFYDGEPYRWIDRIKFIVWDYPIYFGDFFLINFPSGYYNPIFANPAANTSLRKGIWAFLGKGNFYWEI